jgi:hypothetical protein
MPSPADTSSRKSRGPANCSPPATPAGAGERRPANRTARSRLTRSRGRHEAVGVGAAEPKRLREVDGLLERAKDNAPLLLRNHQ